jgi:choline dehydrogenase-like flavoprotein
VKIETQAMLPSLFATLINWTGGLDFKMQALKLRHFNGFIIIARDRDTGRVYPDPGTGLPRIAYTPSAFDRAHVMNGIAAAAKMIYASGALEVHVMISGVAPFIRDPDSSPAEIDLGIKEPRFVEWLEGVKRIGNSASLATWVCAHQMGSNRMSVLEKDGVVDPKGRVWGTEGLYVSDASIFPSATGVNPMVTNMAISDWISRGISKDFNGVTEATL